MMATAGRVTVAEVEKLVRAGRTRPPTRFIRPGIFVQRIIHGAGYRRQIENRTIRKRPAAGVS